MFDLSIFLTTLTKPSLIKKPNPEEIRFEEPVKIKNENEIENTKKDVNNKRTNSRNEYTIKSYKTKVPGQKINLIGDNIYSEDKLKSIISSCGNDSIKIALKECASKITTNFLKDGYINSRVYSYKVKDFTGLEIIKGIVSEIHIYHDDKNFKNVVFNELKEIKGSILHMPTISNKLVKTKELLEIDQITGNINRLGSDPSQAVLKLNIDKNIKNTIGELVISNYGKLGVGNINTNLNIIQKNIIKSKDLLILSTENTSNDLNLSDSTKNLISYQLPIKNDISIHSTFGVSNEVIKDLDNYFKFDQSFISIGLNKIYSQKENSIINTFIDVNISNKSSYLNDQPFPLIIGSDNNGELRTGYLTIGISSKTKKKNKFYSATIAGSAPLPFLSSKRHLDEFNSYGIELNKSKTLAASLGLIWRKSPKLTIDFKTALQTSFNKLPGDMYFTLGNDSGLYAFPNSFRSGENGLIINSKINYLIYENEKFKYFVAPFFSMGSLNNLFKNTYSSLGLTKSIILTNNLQTDLTIVKHMFNQKLDFSQNGLLNDGLSFKLRYRF